MCVLLNDDADPKFLRVLYVISIQLPRRPAVSLLWYSALVLL